ncbi:uncharacterized protein LOC125629058 [Caretta caretta]|uniref:uncharacterized protein LOC125629058 n=1 Tax=Caretta caretta TaxID=8467 RepID=UPI003F4C62F9
MVTIPGSAIVLIWLFSSSMEDAVTQTQPSVSGAERESISLDCTYETVASSYIFYWYKQPSREKPKWIGAPSRWLLHPVLRVHHQVPNLPLVPAAPWVRPDLPAGREPSGECYRAAVRGAAPGRWETQPSAHHQLLAGGLRQLPLCGREETELTMASGSGTALWSLLLTFAFLFSCCEAQVVQSPEWLVTGEGKVSTMSCSFTSAYQTFYWYQQLPGQGPTHLLTTSSNDNVTVGRFIGERLESGKRSSLHITDSQLGDSGSYLCAVDAHSDNSGAVDGKVSQPAALLFLAGGRAELPCNHSVAGYERICWYSQRPGAAPRAVISGYKSTETSERFELSIDPSGRSAPLRITEVAVEDSGVYYCAVRGTARGNAGRAEQKPPRVSASFSSCPGLPHR